MTGLSIPLVIAVGVIALVAGITYCAIHLASIARSAYEMRYRMQAELRRQLVSLDQGMHRDTARYARLLKREMAADYKNYRDRLEQLLTQEAKRLQAEIHRIEQMVSQIVADIAASQAPSESKASGAPAPSSPVSSPPQEPIDWYKDVREGAVRAGGAAAVGAPPSTSEPGAPAPAGGTAAKRKEPPAPVGMSWKKTSEPSPLRWLP